MPGLITLTFDDGYTSIFENVLPLLNQYDIPGVFAIPLDHTSIEKTEKKPITKYQSWLTATANSNQPRHEIAAHGIAHRDFTKLSDTDLQSELLEPRDVLNAKTLIYPGGAYNKQVINLAQKYYLAARTVQSGINRRSPESPLTLLTYNWSQTNWSLYKANLLALWASISNHWLIETYHLIDNQLDLLHTVPLSDFTAHLIFINHLTIKFTNIKDVFL